MPMSNIARILLILYIAQVLPISILDCNLWLGMEQLRHEPTVQW